MRKWQQVNIGTEHSGHSFPMLNALRMMRIVVITKMTTLKRMNNLLDGRIIFSSETITHKMYNNRSQSLVYVQGSLQTFFFCSNGTLKLHIEELLEYDLEFRTWF